MRRAYRITSGICSGLAFVNFLPWYMAGRAVLVGVEELRKRGGGVS